VPGNDPMNITSQIWPGIAPQWPDLATGGSLLSSPAWIRALSGRGNKRTITIVVSADGEPRVAALATVRSEPEPGQFYDLHHVLISPAPALPLTEAARAARTELAGSAPPAEHWVPSLVVMLPGYECEPVGPGRDDARLLGELTDAACRWAAEQDLRSVAFLYTRPDAKSLAAALTERGFVGMPLSLTWDLVVPDGGFTGYLASLSSKRRREAQRELARVADAGVRIRHLDHDETSTEPVRAAMTALRSQLVRKYRGYADEQGERAKLDMLIRDVCSDRAHVVAALADDHMVGFALFAPYGATWYCLATGFDYADPRSRLCYFATLFYAAVPVAAQGGARSLGYGQGSGHAKRSRGCVGTPLAGWMRSEDPALTEAALASAAVTRLQPGA